MCSCVGPSSAQVGTVFFVQGPKAEAIRPLARKNMIEQAELFAELNVWPPEVEPKTSIELVEPPPETTAPSG